MLIKKWMKRVRKEHTITVDDPIPRIDLEADDWPCPEEPLTLRSLLTRHGTVDLEIEDVRNLDRKLKD